MSIPGKQCLATGLVALAAAIPVAGCGETHPLQGTRIVAAGVLPARLADAWDRGFTAKTGSAVWLRPMGSAGATRALIEGKASLAEIGEPLSDRQMAATGHRGALMHIPLALSPIAVTYQVTKWRHRQVPIASGLAFDGATLAVIFRGRIENWVNTRILGRNPDPEIPDELIIVCHRSDPAATTEALTSYLTGRSAWWRRSTGAGEQIVWKVVGHFHVPMRRAGSDAGMVRCLKDQPASIGYLDAADADAARAHLSVARVVNRAGRFIAPSVTAAEAAGAAVKPPADLRFSTIDTASPSAYPIVAVRYALVWQDLCRAGFSTHTAAAVKGWLEYVLADGQQQARRLGFAPLPANIRRMAKGKVDALECNGKAIG